MFLTYSLRYTSFYETTKNVLLIYQGNIIGVSHISRCTKLDYTSAILEKKISVKLCLFSFILGAQKILLHFMWKEVK